MIKNVRKWRCFAMLTLSAALFFCLFAVSGARCAAGASGLAPKTVRVGLMSSDPETAEGPVDSAKLYSERGLMASRVDGAGNVISLVKIMFVADSTELVVRKYSHGGAFAVAATPASNGAAGGYEAASLLAASLSREGFSCAICHMSADGSGGSSAGGAPGEAGREGWRVVIGAYASRDEAQQIIDSKLGGTAPIGALAGASVEPVGMGGLFIAADLSGATQFICEANGGGVRFAPEDGTVVSLSGKPTRGAIEFMRISGSDMTVVGVMSTDEYLYGVVPREIEASSPADALRAQAVAARTYASQITKRHAAHGFDLCQTVHCQVYGGYSGEHPNSTAAVDSTSGQVVAYGGALAQVFYFSSSGGQTEDVKNVWGSSFPYLISVEDPYESGESRYYNWDVAYTADQIKDQLAATGVDIGDVLSVAITKRSSAGRAIEVKVAGSRQDMIYKNEACRTFIKDLRSQSYNILPGGGYAAVSSGGEFTSSQVVGAGAVSSSGAVELTGDAVGYADDGGIRAVSGTGAVSLTQGLAANSFRFVGKGWGHAVGMSQEGAKGMASHGYTYNQILAHYFPGCEIVV